MKQILQMRNIACSCTEALIVDDNEFNLHSLKTILKTYHVASDLANSGDCGIEFVEKRLRNNFCCP